MAEIFFPSHYVTLIRVIPTEGMVFSITFRDDDDITQGEFDGAGMETARKKLGNYKRVKKANCEW